MTVNDIKEAICNLFSFTIQEETDQKIDFNVFADKHATLNKLQVEQIIMKIGKMTAEQEIELFDNNKYEVLVRNENRIMFSREIIQTDTVNRIEYKIDRPTDHYLIFFLHNLSKQDTQRILRGGIIQNRLRRIYENPQQTLFEINILDLIKDIVPKLETLQIKSDSIKKKLEYEQLVYAFLFNLGYNLDYTFQPLRFMDEFTQPYRLGRLRRVNFGDVEPPKRVYLNELILHYQKGISSESIDHQFLSFYHVLEYFFEKIYNDDILNSVKSELTKPSFSYKRTKDLTSLISLIQTRLKYRNDEFQINEPEALELTLKKFVKELHYLSSELKTISPSLIDYFKSTEVPFCKGNKVNFDSNNNIEIYSNLARRIYLTRNSIVHSKDTDKSKYTPFRDDKDLLTEIYLMRLIAEIVIIENSKELYNTP